MSRKNLRHIYLSLAIILLIGALYFMCLGPINNFLLSIKRPQIVKMRKEPPNAYENVNIKSMNSIDINKQLVFSKPKGYAVATVKIPGVNLNQQVYSTPGGNGVNLLYGAVVARPNTVIGKNNTVLAGHTMANARGQYFEPLFRAKNGMKTYVTTNNKRYTYKINKTDKHVGLETYTLDNFLDVNSLGGSKHNKPMLTLYTCNDVDPYTGYGRTRLIVQDTLVSEKNL